MGVCQYWEPSKWLVPFGFPLKQPQQGGCPPKATTPELPFKVPLFSPLWGIHSQKHAVGGPPHWAHPPPPLSVRGPRRQDSEEVRLQLGRFVAALLGRCSPTQVYSYVDEAGGASSQHPALGGLYWATKRRSICVGFPIFVLFSLQTP